MHLSLSQCFRNRNRNELSNEAKRANCWRASSSAFSLTVGKLSGFALFDQQFASAPLTLLLAAPRGGKSVWLGRLINDMLAAKAYACVCATDFGESVKRAKALKLALQQFISHSFLDAPTHPDFAGDSPLDVYELDSLNTSRSACVKRSLTARQPTCCVLFLHENAARRTARRLPCSAC